MVDVPEQIQAAFAIGGLFRFARVVTSAYNAQVSDGIIFIDPTAAGFDVTLPSTSALRIPGNYVPVLWVSRVDAGSNPVNIVAGAGDTIATLAQLALGPGASWLLAPNGNDWRRLSAA